MNQQISEREFISDYNQIIDSSSILRSLFDSSHVCIAHLDTDCNFVAVNNAYAATDDKTPDYFIGKNHFDLYPHEENERIFRNAIATGEKYVANAKPFEYEYNPDRGVSHWDWTLTPVKSRTGQVTGLVLILLNVTDRIQAIERASTNELKLYELNQELEDAVAARTAELENERNFRDIVLETQAALVLVVDDSGKVVCFNKACEEVSGYKREEVTGKLIWDALIWPNHRNDAIEILKTLPSNINHSRFEFCLSCKDGDKRLISWSASVIDEEINYKNHVVLTGIDITESRNTEQLLKRTSENFDIAQRLTKIGCWEYDVTTNRLWWSEEYYRIFGLSPDEAKPCKQLYLKSIHKDDLLKAEMELNALIDKGYKDVTLKIVRPDGGVRDIHEIAQVEFNKFGKPVLMKGTVQDITDITKAEAERNRLQRQLKQAQKMEAIGHLTGGIAHDFNNILAAILGFTQLTIARFVPDGEGTLAEYLHEIDTAGKRASALVKQMLAYSRGDNQDLNRLNPVPVIKESIKMLQSTIPSSIQITLDICEMDAVVEANALQLQQAIINLIVNARYALGEKGNIHIICKKIDLDSSECASCHKQFSGEHFLISIKDTGGGIAQDILPSIFEPFFTTKPVGEGTGMGLSMVHGYVHSSGGHILVDVETGKTTTINLYFPVYSEKPDYVDERSTENRIHHKLVNNIEKKILIVDDEKSLVSYLCDYLQLNNYQVDCTTSSKEALGLIKKHPQDYDLLITDQSMPEITGVELIKEVKKINPDIPIVICTGFSEVIDETNFQEKGANYYLPKPVKPENLLYLLNGIFKK